jgi:hypothetical protein
MIKILHNNSGAATDARSEIYTLMIGGWWLWPVFISLMISFILIDAVMSDDLTEPSIEMSVLLNLSPLSFSL